MSAQTPLHETEGPIQPSTTNPSHPATSTSPAVSSLQSRVANSASAPETSRNPATSSHDTPEPSPSPAPIAPVAATKPDNAVRISLLLTNGARHPFTINKKFLQRRNISSQDDDPWNISVYDMKSLIWHEWLAEWETRPSSPAYIRLIFLGGLLDDKHYLKDCRFSRTEPNVVHMTVKPQDIPDEEDMKSKENKASGNSSRSGSGCCIIL